MQAHKIETLNSFIKGMNKKMQSDYVKKLSISWWFHGAIRSAEKRITELQNDKL